MVTLRWLVVVVLWAALDLSGPLLPLPVESAEEWENVAARTSLRRRDRAPERRTPGASPREVRDETARRARLVAAVAPRREQDAGTARKLPPTRVDPDSLADDH